MTSEAIFVIGTRAQLVKVAPVLLEAVKADLAHVVWFTGQHRESIEDLILDFGLSSRFMLPERHRERSSIGLLINWVPGTLLRCARFLKERKRFIGGPPVVVVHGDTASTLVGAIAARVVGCKVVHLESGLSSLRLFDPFPEELVRRAVFRLSNLALCPNDQAVAVMSRFPGCQVVHSGENTLLDSVRLAIGEAKDLEGPPERYFVASIHRFSNIFSTRRLTHIVEELVALSEIARVYFVLHPATERKLRESGLRDRLDLSGGICLMPRMSYSLFLSLLADADLVVTDGGSNQEELSYLGVPTVLMRERSERPDGIGANVVFEADVPFGLAEFVRVGADRIIRRAPLLGSTARPSCATVRAISELGRASS